MLRTISAGRLRALWGRSRRGRVAILAAPLLAGVVSACTATTPAPAYPGDFPDPSVIRVGTMYYAFATQAGGGHPAVQRLVSTDHTHWSRPAQPEALTSVPTWADYAGTWAPTVDHIGGKYLLYYSVHQISGNECVSVATAASITDQFVDNSRQPLVCRPSGESIDPSTFQSPSSGRRYLLWKGPDDLGVATLYSRRLAADGRSLLGPTIELLKAQRTDWTNWNIEGPTMLFSGGKYYLFYSGGDYWTTRYGIGYAVCSSPLGPCTNMSPTQAWVGTRSGAQGPGGQSFFTDNTGALFMAYHAWANQVGYENGGVRSMWVGPMHFSSGVPVLG